jgi:hypothetical protein
MTVPRQALDLEQQAAAEKVKTNRDIRTADQRRLARSGNVTARAALLAVVNGQIKAEESITGLIKRLSDPPQYYLLVEGRERVALGGIEGVSSALHFRNRVGQTLDWFPAAAAKTWPELSNHLMACLTTEQVDDDETDAGRARRWVTDYLCHTRHPAVLGFAAADNAFANGVLQGPRQQAEARNRDLVECIRLQHSFVEYDAITRGKGPIHFFLPALKLHIRDSSHGSESPTSPELAKALRAAGFSLVRKKVKRDNTESTVSVWSLPEGFPLLPNYD